MCLKWFFHQMRRVVLSFFALWFAVIQTLMPSLILAQELPTEIVASPSPVAELTTGDAYATTTSLGITDTTLINSEIEVVQSDITDPGTAAIELFPDTPANLEENSKIDPSATPSALPTRIVLDNETVATVASTTTVETGNNTQITAGQAKMETGDAYATSYATSISNTTLVDSKIEVALLNLLTPWDGNLILQPLTTNDKEVLRSSIGELQISNSGEVVTMAQAEAITGSDIQITQGSAVSETGNGMASASTTALVNTTLENAILLDFLIHNLSLWSGQVYNWDSPGSRQDPSAIVGRHLITGENGDCVGCQIDLVVDNTVNSTTLAQATANTGGNLQIAGTEATILTGNAFASAKAATVANTTLVNSQYRLIDLTLFAPWSGNLIFAYPDLAVTIDAPQRVSSGSELTYVVTVENTGYSKDTGVVLASGNITENLGGIASLTKITRSYTIPTDKFQGQIELSAVVKGNLEEESLSNNTATKTVLIDQPKVNADAKTESVSHEIPTLTLTATNNIATFIYPGDTTRYEIVLTNEGPGLAYDTVFNNYLVNEQGSVVGMITVPIGQLAANEKKYIRFGLNTAPNLPANEYHTLSVVTGRSYDKTTISSNEVANRVPVRSRLVTIANAVEIENIPLEVTQATGNVLGTKTTSCANCKYAWILLAVTTALSSLYTYAGRKLQSKRLLTMAVAWGALGYVALLLVNPDCVNNGFTLVSGSALCTYFLPIALGQGIVQRLITTQKIPAFTRINLALARKMSRQ